MKHELWRDRLVCCALGVVAAFMLASVARMWAHMAEMVSILGAARAYAIGSTISVAGLLAIVMVFSPDRHV
jgi:hypothetical protein